MKGDSKGELEAVIVESRLDRKKGVLVSCIVRNGTLRIGDKVVASGHSAKIKSITDDKGRILKEASLSEPVEILGFSWVPNVGDKIVYEKSELVELSVDTERAEIVGKDAKRAVAVVLKADTQGTLEAVKGSLADLVSSSVEASYALKFLHCATGDITESDAMLAQSAKGVVIGFNVRIPPVVEEFAESQSVPVKTYKTIYELIDDAKNLLEGTAVKEESKIKGRAQVIKLFKLPSGDVVAGSKVLAGALKVGSKISVYDKDPADLSDKDVPIYIGNIKSLKKGKDEINVIGRDNECGVLLKPQYDDIKVGMWIEVR